VVGPPVALDGSGFEPRGPVAALGSESDRVLADLGFDASAIEALVSDGIVRRDVFAPDDA